MGLDIAFAFNAACEALDIQVWSEMSWNGDEAGLAWDGAGVGVKLGLR